MTYRFKNLSVSDGFIWAEKYPYPIASVDAKCLPGGRAVVTVESLTSVYRCTVKSSTLTCAYECAMENVAANIRFGYF